MMYLKGMHISREQRHGTTNEEFLHVRSVNINLNAIKLVKSNFPESEEKTRK